MSGVGARGPGRRSGALRVLLLVVGAVAFLAGIVGRGYIADDAPHLPGGHVVSDPLQGVVPAGPTALVQGMPAGFAQTEDGAVAAASAFITTGEALMNMDPLAIEEAVRQMSAAAVADRRSAEMVDNLDTVRDVLQPGQGPVLFRQAALAARVDDFDDDTATVAVWNVSVLSREQVAAPQASWQTTTVELVWERDDWRIERMTNSHGPAPVLSNSGLPATSAQLAQALDGFVPLLPGPRSQEPG